ncbi:MAG TPA: multifunctional CCA addition/repair protein [Gammaproteobacteria bacterium]|nr:multifunctional CCA addition/repair protein [Gammaproteobacteria bacterium]
MQIYRVGGAVRDRLLGLPTVDCDWVVVGASEEEMLALGYRRVGKDFPVFLHPTTQEEYALARTERKQGRGYTGFAVDAARSVTLEEDLARRDLTINAMAEDAEGRLIDPYGGQRDLAARVLRHVTAAFVEDPLRTLRVARFAARLNFTVAPETLALMREITASGELATLTPERVWRELERALGEPYPARFFEVLRDCGALAAVLPEVDALFGVPQPAQHHPEIDCGVHLLLCLTQAVRLGASTRVRFAVLMHDLGKGTTPPALLPGHIGHEDRSVRLLNALCDRLRVPQALRELAVVVAREHTNVHRGLELRQSTLVDLLERMDAFRRPERLADILLACEIDARGRAGLENRDYPQAARLRRAFDIARAVDVAPLVAAHGPGPEIKSLLRDARIAALKSAGV